MENELWDEYSIDYDKKVFSLTKVPSRRKQIIDKLRLGKVLNMGAGPTPYLNRALLKKGNEVVASDYCLAMINAAKRKLMHPNLEYVLADSCNLPFDDNSFDSVISVNSILPPRRRDIQLMVDESYRVLKNDGIFAAFLCSFESVKEMLCNFKIWVTYDNRRMAVKDTVGWQCFHTKKTIDNMIVKSDFADYKLQKIFLKTKQEVAEIKRLYDINTAKVPLQEYLLVAYKN